MNIDKIIDILIGNHDDKRAENFLHFLSGKLWDLYDDFLMDKIKMAENEIVWNLNIPNAKENQEYAVTVNMPVLTSEKLAGIEVALVDVSGLDQNTHGLSIAIEKDRKSFTISGCPSLDYFRKDGATAKSTFELTLYYQFTGIDMPTGYPVLKRKIPFIINQDPRKLWKNLPVDWENMPMPKYRCDDIQAEYIKVQALADGSPQKDIVAASKRGRSHAQEAKPRDDYFKITHLDNGWYVMAVADGAGSAKFSRAGSHIACEVSVKQCIASLNDNNGFEDAILKYNEQMKEGESEVRKLVGDYIYKIVGTAAFNAHRAINLEASRTKIQSKQYATTLLLTIIKKFHFGWFLASFWVGDGAICLYDKKTHTVKILGVPDEGEYAGQTRFLTMPDIFKDATSFYQRLRFNIVDDFTALFMMTDGVSDPKFETEANLNNPDKWDALWRDLRENGVELTDDNESSKDQLLNWLDFWSPGNHDDRTIAILYEGEETAPKYKEVTLQALEKISGTKDTEIVSAYNINAASQI